MHLVFEISSSQNWFWNLILELDFLSISNLVFTACVACKNPVQNRQKIKLKNQFREIEISKNQVQIDKGKVVFSTDLNFLFISSSTYSAIGFSQKLSSRHTT